ncbi:hypothetical protein B0H11DRAFT_1903737 [Mycena galericulata]|nr:hypothetical protein B0H11DRAFT_1903737 [Mycena galericulata]
MGQTWWLKKSRPNKVKSTTDVNNVQNEPSVTPTDPERRSKLCEPVPIEEFVILKFYLVLVQLYAMPRCNAKCQRKLTDETSTFGNRISGPCGGGGLTGLRGLDGRFWVVDAGTKKSASQVSVSQYSSYARMVEEKADQGLEPGVTATIEVSQGPIKGLEPEVTATIGVCNCDT